MYATYDHYAHTITYQKEKSKCVRCHKKIKILASLSYHCVSGGGGGKRGGRRGGKGSGEGDRGLLGCNGCSIEQVGRGACAGRS